jgi:hypothetical protein
MASQREISRPENAGKEFFVLVPGKILRSAMLIWFRETICTCWTLYYRHKRVGRDDSEVD